MKLGKVVGTVVSTINHPFYDARRLLICDLVTLGGTPDGYIIAKIICCLIVDFAFKSGNSDVWIFFQFIIVR